MESWSSVLDYANEVQKINKRKTKIILGGEIPERVLFCLNSNNPFRKFVIKFVEWKYISTIHKNTYIIFNLLFFFKL